MWFIYAIIHAFLMAVVNFTDEHLVTNECDLYHIES